MVHTARGLPHAREGELVTVNYAEIVRGNAPVVVHVPHAGTRFPGVASTAFRPHIDRDFEIRKIADLHMDAIYGRIRGTLAARGIEPFSVVNPNARLFMDPERFPDDREEMNAVGMGVVYDNGYDLQPLYAAPLPEAERAHRIHAYYDPYTQALIDVTREAIDRFGRVLFVDLHSYATEALPCELHPDEGRPPLCIGLDGSIHDPDPAHIAALEARFDSAINEPYHGTYVPSPWYRRDPRLRSIMLEVRKDQYMDEATFATTPASAALAERIGEWIAEVVSG